MGTSNKDRQYWIQWLSDKIRERIENINQLKGNPINKAKEAARIALLDKAGVLSQMTVYNEMEVQHKVLQAEEAALSRNISRRGEDIIEAIKSIKPECNYRYYRDADQLVNEIVEASYYGSLPGLGADGQTIYRLFKALETIETKIMMATTDKNLLATVQDLAKALDIEL